MNDESMINEHPGGEPKRKRPIGKIIVTGVVVAVFLASGAWYSTKPNVPDEPVRLVRNEKGELVPESGEESSSGLNAHAAGLAASNNTSTSSSEMRSGNARFSDKRLLIRNESDHLLMERIGGELLEQIRKWPRVEQVDYLPKGFDAADKIQTPDLLITLRPELIEESGAPLRRKLKATIQVEAGNTLNRCRAGYTDHLSPPIVRSRMHCTVNHQSTLTGIESPGAKFQLAGANIAKEIAAQLQKKFDELYEKDGPIPPLPPAFHPKFRPFELPPVLAARKPKNVATFHGRMSHNESLWRFEADKTPPEVLPEIRDALKDDGWSIKSYQEDQKSIAHIRAHRGTATLTVYPLTKDFVMRESKDSPTKPAVYHIHYEDRMSQAEMQSAVDTVFAGDPDLEVLLFLENLLSQEQSKRLLEKLKENGPNSTDQWLSLAKLQKRFESNQAALQSLQRAYVMARVSGGDEGPIKNLAKELGEKNFSLEHPEPALLEELGFGRVGPDATFEDFERKMGQPVCFYGVDDQGEVVLLSYTMKEPGVLSHSFARHHHRSWGSGGSSNNRNIEGLCRVRATGTAIEGSDRFRLSVSCEPAPPAPKDPKPPVKAKENSVSDEQPQT